LKRNGGFGGGVDMLIQHLGKWRADGEMAGLALS